MLVEVLVGTTGIFSNSFSVVNAWDGSAVEHPSNIITSKATAIFQKRLIISINFIKIGFLVQFVNKRQIVSGK